MEISTATANPTQGLSDANVICDGQNYPEQSDSKQFNTRISTSIRRECSGDERGKVLDPFKGRGTTILCHRPSQYPLCLQG